MAEVSKSLVDVVDNGILTLGNFHATVFKLISTVNRNDGLRQSSDYDKIKTIGDVMIALCHMRPEPLQSTLLQLTQTTIAPLYYAIKPVYIDNHQSLIDAQGDVAYFNHKQRNVREINGRKFALKKQKPDDRDYKLTLNHVILPAEIDLRKTPYITPVLDQGNIGSCAAHASAAALHMLLKKEGVKEFDPSRLFIYYMTRVNVEHEQPDSDSGCTLRDICQSIKDYHTCDETLWPYDTSKYMVSPPANAVLNANLHTKLKFCAVKQDLNSMKNCLANGFPFIIGIQIYQSFQSDETMRTGIVKLPSVNTEELLGGHALLVVGYNDSHRHFIIQNSWSSSIADKGFFYIPYDYLTNRDLGSDYWSFQLFE
jgi:C1A family cysteine protease